MKTEIMEALVTILICGVLGAVVWERMAVTLWWLVVAVVLIGVVGGVLMVTIDRPNPKHTV